MALTVRYFSTASAGAGDGTTWADRAALFSAGNWSTVITGFAFGSDALEARIGPGTYTCGQTLNATTITTDPTNANPLLLHACDSSGNLISPPDPDWTSDLPVWDDSTMPVIATTTNIVTTGTAGTMKFRLIKFTASGRNGNVVEGVIELDWCIVVNSTSNSSATAGGTVIVRAYNCHFQCSGTSYANVMTMPNGGFFVNCRFQGNLSASSGNRRGIEGTTRQTA